MQPANRPNCRYTYPVVGGISDRATDRADEFERRKPVSFRDRVPVAEVHPHVLPRPVIAIETTVTDMIASG